MHVLISIQQKSSNACIYVGPTVIMHDMRTIVWMHACMYPQPSLLPIEWIVRNKKKVTDPKNNQSTGTYLWVLAVFIPVAPGFCERMWGASGITRRVRASLRRVTLDLRSRHVDLEPSKTHFTSSHKDKDLERSNPGPSVRVDQFCLLVVAPITRRAHAFDLTRSRHPGALLYMFTHRLPSSRWCNEKQDPRAQQCAVTGS